MRARPANGLPIRGRIELNIVSVRFSPQISEHGRPGDIRTRPANKQNRGRTSRAVAANARANVAPPFFPYAASSKSLSSNGEIDAIFENIYCTSMNFE